MRAASAASAELSSPVTEGRWLRPSSSFPAEPRWGHENGIQLGLHPLHGPRGLLRIYAPYLDHPRGRLVNFIAIEPIPAGETERGYSELEHSAIDHVQGKRFWSADSPCDATPQQPTQPARGVLETIDGIGHLHVYVLSERFDNGADVSVRVSFRSDRPHELTLATFARDASIPLDACIVTATMGNFARLRELQLAERIVTPRDVWPDFAGEHFTEHARFGLAELARNGDAALVSARPDEAAPHEAEYVAGTAEHWKYVGTRAEQTWRVEDPHDELEVRVNGRHAYWMSSSPIPGGVAYENFELVEPFRQGREFHFSVEPLD